MQCQNQAKERYGKCVYMLPTLSLAALPTLFDVTLLDQVLCHLPAE